MDHLQSLATKASERYLLGEMSEPERFEFEEHYFRCLECAKDVRAGAALARGIRALGRQELKVKSIADAQPRRPGSRSTYFSPALVTASAAAFVLACVAGYQGLVTVPGLREVRAMAPLVLRAAARGDEQIVRLSNGQPYSILSLDVNAAEPGTPLRYEIAPPNSSPRIDGEAVAPPVGSPLLIVVPHSALRREGAWTLVLRTSSGQEIAQYPFQLRF